MRVKSIHVTTLFAKHFRKLSSRDQEEAIQKERIFRLNPFDARLKTHKLHGKEKETWAFSVSYSCRIKFIFLDEDSVLLLDIGTHDIYS